MKARKQSALKSVQMLPGELERKYGSMVQNATDGIFQVTLDGRFLSVNPALARIAGYDSPKEMMKSTADLAQRAYVSPERRLEYVKLLKTEGRVSNFECQLQRKNGVTHWVSIDSHAVRDGAGKVLYFEGHLQDITERKLAEEQLILQRDLALDLAKVSSLDEALSLTIHAVSRISGCECAGIYLRNSATGDLELASSAGLSEKFLKEVARAAVGSDAWFLSIGKKKAPHTSPWMRTRRWHAGRLSLRKAFAPSPLSPPSTKGASSPASTRIRGADTIPASSRSTLELIGAQLGNIIVRLQAEQELQKDLERRKQMEEALQDQSPQS